MEIVLNDKHQYLVNDIHTISVTQILHRMFPKKYEGIPEEILNKAADRGNKIHWLIERYALSPNDDNKMDMEIFGVNYALLKDINEIEIESSEQKIAYIDNGNPLYAGMYDLKGSVKGENAILDIKCTSKCDKKYLQWQLSMYAIAFEQMTGEKIEKLACIWMPKNGVGKYVPIERIKTDDVLKEVREIVQA